ncbi:MAG: U32 family peptidase [Deltaproteobacteria bacterium]|nr:U32 family peptidase [Deltaproteobacteria bacterium]
MKRKIELLAPGGDIDAIKAAIAAGADAVYCGLNKFNARNRAKNLDFEALNRILTLAHRNNCKIYLTLNIIILASEIPALIGLLNKLVNTSIDGVIVQDLGLLYLLSTYFKGLKIHASTQLTTHNEGQIKFLKKLSVTQVNLSRELNIDEIKALTSIAYKNNMLTEVFVHGSYCISFSGLCYMSSVLWGKSGNRGRCSQPCRDRYLTTPEGKNFPLNLKDNSAYSDLKEISDAGVSSLKIEGRMKKLDYVYTVVDCWKKQLQTFHKQNILNSENGELYKVFNRDFSNAYLKNDISKNMFIDNPRDNSIQHLSDINDYSTNNEMLEDQAQLYDEKESITANIKHKIKQLDIVKVPLRITISGKIDAPLKISVKTPDTSFVVVSKINLSKSSSYKRLDYDLFVKKLRALNNTGYFIKHLDLENLQSDLFISFKELTSMKKKILATLNGLDEIIETIDVPFLKKRHTSKSMPDLSLLICAEADLDSCYNVPAQVFFEIPNCFRNRYSESIGVFLRNKKLIPWFPPILIGDDYSAAIELLKESQAKLIVTNNTGIAYEAYQMGISWIAGPYLNVVNSFALLCLKEKFGCCGSFISNEISRNQIKNIISPEHFKLYYSIYHPILLLSSRQCLIHPVIGCEKSRIDRECIEKCDKSASILNLKQVPLFIEKTKGNYHCVYNDANFLNTDVVTDFPEMFSSFFIDLRDIQTETRIKMHKHEIITLFENLLKGDPDSKRKLHQVICPTTKAQYEKGI